MPKQRFPPFDGSGMSAFHQFKTTGRIDTYKINLMLADSGYRAGAQQKRGFSEFLLHRAMNTEKRKINSGIVRIQN
ncbi:hypothetical protein PT279_02315 [Bifidobacterium sp. ESL0784]|uniref:hypothetical protein n=1 Tax=Bifidobacterium sp. ESL0784 TaxID=2983231 RepID=UPI0023F9F322|nr:hypothetical protein [Bifidobacterium sp. ESL0784]MDF7640429.1 hypothetical protein [Bifidobacterium sp. ESL0784]